MKNIFCLLIAALALLACKGQAVPSGSAVVRVDTVHYNFNFGILFTRADAEKILGEASHVEDSTVSQTSEATNYSAAYKANVLDPKTAKTGAIYIMLQQYTETSAAQNRYSFVKTANQNHGITVLTGVGDEAYYHTDNQNFYFIMARKGARMLTLKVNKITSHTSKEEFNRIVKQVVAML